MTKFIDEKKNEIIDVANSGLISHFRSLASGATLPLPYKLVDWSEIEQVVGLRQPPRNTGIGIVMTKPNDSSFFLETVWEDHADNNQHDGDITLFTEQSPETFNFVRMKIEEMKKKYPAWHGYHHGNKDYLK